MLYYNLEYDFGKKIIALLLEKEINKKELTIIDLLFKILVSETILK